MLNMSSGSTQGNGEILDGETSKTYSDPLQQRSNFLAILFWDSISEASVHHLKAFGKFVQTFFETPD
jgi:hypothetical protein